MKLCERCGSCRMQTISPDTRRDVMLVRRLEARRPRAIVGALVYAAVLADIEIESEKKL